MDLGIAGRWAVIYAASDGLGFACAGVLGLGLCSKSVIYGHLLYKQKIRWCNFPQSGLKSSSISADLSSKPILIAGKTVFVCKPSTLTRPEKRVRK